MRGCQENERFVCDLPEGMDAAADTEDLAVA